MDGLRSDMTQFYYRAFSPPRNMPLEERHVSAGNPSSSADAHQLVHVLLARLFPLYVNSMKNRLKIQLKLFNLPFKVRLLCHATVTIEQVEISPSYFGVKPEDLNVHAAAAREDSRPMPSRPGGHIRGATGMQGQGSAHKDKVRGLAGSAK